ncbi:MAG: hypothetical protein PW789_04825 [Edaphobacter sp.]|uniref:hypothetical protein n=1 Tax=Edaphobacter sp. TaxID=1934404 RepID=UPI002394964A|nr:hypothetical protein [Edaphobacter sp.]MDE1175911.1 hypothetical protein [Edaphobacter sp.]
MNKVRIRKVKNHGVKDMMGAVAVGVTEPVRMVRVGRRETRQAMEAAAKDERPHLCRLGRMEGYDPKLDAQADHLEALRCLAFLVRHDAGRPDKVREYVAQIDLVLDKMECELRES